jgi:hypothetical protein
MNAVYPIYSMSSMSIHSVLPPEPKQLTMALLEEKFPALESALKTNEDVSYASIRAISGTDHLYSDGTTVGSLAHISVGYKNGISSFLFYIGPNGNTYTRHWDCKNSAAEEQRIREWLYRLRNE